MDQDARSDMARAGTGAEPGDEAAPGTPGTGEAVCGRCQGSGKIGGKDCPMCGGTGKVTEGIGGG
jgi:DnaJ-class molecular chaperone